MSKPAKLPDELRKMPSRMIKDIAVGERVPVNFTDLFVSAGGDCYIRLSGKPYERPNRSTIWVTRKAEGYAVEVDGQDFRWEYSETSTPPGELYAPAIAVTVLTK